MPKAHVSTTVNGDPYEFLCEAGQTLVDVLRNELELTGTKEGCSTGDCGACSVIVDGELVCSCLTLAVETDGSKIETIEGMAAAGKLHQVQEAFLKHEAMQCGYCVPGHIMTAIAFARENPKATRSDVVDTMSEHICRCCNYSSILAAVEQAVSGDQGGRD